ncbi:hypothetical protein JCM14469_42140 [Desulfatiferula olefinivorans]
MTMKRNYYRIMLGRKSAYAKECFDGSFIGGDWGMDFDLNGKLPENWRDFNKEFIPVYLELNPEKSKVAAGLACGMLHTICKGICIGDIVISPNGSGAYYVGEVAEDYTYVPGGILPHRRNVKWYPKTIDRSEMSQGLQNSAGSIATVSNIAKHAAEIEGLLAGNAPPQLIATDELVEDPTVFALEKHLEDFLVRNWAQTELGKNYDIVEDDGEIVGQQYPSDTGPIDILAISKDKKEYLVVELKKGRASDAVVGQVQRYMGFVLEDLSEADQSVRGVIIALEDDLRLRRALKVTNNIDFYKYQVSFKLFKH